jgi:hypothetical protein
MEMTMIMFRRIIRSILIVAFIIACVAIIAAFLLLGFRDPTAWVAVAAGLAVITSIASAWPAQRVLELQQDAQEPYPYPSIDVTSRYALLQLRVTNYGGSAAFDIRFGWNEPLLNSKGQTIQFTKQKGAPDIPVLLPNESVTILIDEYKNMFQTYKNMNYTGELVFRNASGQMIRHPFLVSAEKYRHALTYSEEELKTHFQLQQIPKEICKLRTEVTHLRSAIEQTAEIIIARNDNPDLEAG